MISLLLFFYFVRKSGYVLYITQILAIKRHKIPRRMDGILVWITHKSRMSKTKKKKKKKKKVDAGI